MGGSLGLVSVGVLVEVCLCGMAGEAQGVTRRCRAEGEGVSVTA